MYKRTLFSIILYRNTPFNKDLKISHKINDKDAYLYLHTTKQDI